MAKIRFIAKSDVSSEDLARNRRYSHRLGLPEVGSKPVTPKLAVLGGGPSIANMIEELRAWDGELWAINGVFQWCLRHDIEATCYRIDPAPMLTEDEFEGVERAVLADTVHPDIFDALKGKKVELAKLDKISNGPSAAATAPIIAAHRGHKHVTLFGCESSFEGDTHAYKNAPENRGRLWVECGGREYKTHPQFIMQAEFLAALAIGAPEYLHVEGEGFLSALVKHGDYEVTHTSRDISEVLALKMEEARAYG